MFHAHCFDGAASASLFGRFYTSKIDPTAEIIYRGKAHARGAVFSEDDFDADDHAIVDFRYSPNPKLGWWFDHHVSAFQPPEDEASYRARPHERFFFDPNARSCTKFLTTQLTARYGFDASPYDELVRWADLIDGAQFDSAKQATELKEPALQLMSFFEHNQDETYGLAILSSLTSRPLAELAAEKRVQDVLRPVLERNHRAERVLRERVQVAQGVAFFDVGDDELDGHNKFLPYVVAPESRYVVVVSASAQRTKISVGSNPWNRPDPLVNLARICERYGGGGHAVVGAVTLPGGTLPEARRIAHEITDELRASPTAQ
jgi:hypothetical protein